MSDFISIKYILYIVSKELPHGVRTYVIPVSLSRLKGYDLEFKRLLHE